MPRWRHTFAVAIGILGVLIGALLAIAVGDPAVPMVVGGGASTGIGYWLGAVLHRRKSA
jgi:hypothetical protein